MRWVVVNSDQPWKNVSWAFFPPPGRTWMMLLLELQLFSPGNLHLRLHLYHSLDTIVSNGFGTPSVAGHILFLEGRYPPKSPEYNIVSNSKSSICKGRSGRMVLSGLCGCGPYRRKVWMGHSFLGRQAFLESNGQLIFNTRGHWPT